MIEEYESLGDQLAKGLVSPSASGVNISYGTVKAVNEGNGTVSLNVSVHGGTLYGIPMTTACKGVAVGDRCIVETYGNLSTVTGIIAHDNRHYVSPIRVNLGNVRTVPNAVTLVPVDWPIDPSRIVSISLTYICHDQSDRIVLSNWTDTAIELRASADQYISATIFVLYE